MKKWHISFRVDKNDPDSEIKMCKIPAETGKEALDKFYKVCEHLGYNPFTTVFRCEGDWDEIK